jgi:hypothetical protein
MRTLLTLLVTFGLTACSSSAATGSSPATPGPIAVVPAPSQSAGAPGLSADGKRFARDTEYKGSCAPAGSRGGCYSFTFHPDGTAEHVLLDATAHGTYRIEGKAVLFKMTAPDAQEERYESADGFRTLGADYHYIP